MALQEENSVELNIISERETTHFLERTCALCGFNIVERKAKASGIEEWIAVEIRKDDMTCWEFDPSNQHVPKLLCHNDEWLIMLVAKTKLDGFIPLRVIQDSERILDHTRAFEKDPVTYVTVKETLARKHRLIPHWTNGEQLVLDQLHHEDVARRMREQESARQQKEAVLLEKCRAQTAASMAIKRRQKISVLTIHGSYRSGIPVTHEEMNALELLQEGRQYVLVDVFDPQTGKHGEPIEFFEVTKRYGGRATIHNTPVLIGKQSAVYA